MTRIKICGITNAKDARAAVEAGANALGFNFVPESPRYVDIEGEVPEILSLLPPFVGRVGVCFEPSQVPSTLVSRLSTFQYYSDDWQVETPSPRPSPTGGEGGSLTSPRPSPTGGQGGSQPFSDDWQIERYSGKELVRAFRVRDTGSLDEIANALDSGRRRPTALLLDTYAGDRLGGTGETFNWDLAIEAKRRFSLPLILAGGLTPENVEEAIAVTTPYGVDVSSGIEAKPGRKDHKRMTEFVRAVRRADERLDRS